VNICVLSDCHSFGKNWYTGTYVLAANVFDGMPLSLLLNVRGRRRKNEVPLLPSGFNMKTQSSSLDFNIIISNAKQWFQYPRLT
jgi:hypothetical protein